MSAPFCTYKRKEKNGIFTGNKLESIVDFFKDRSSGYDNCLFSGNFLCKKNYEDEAGIESNMGWNPDYATGASADSCWFLFAVDLQSQETFRKISHGEF